MIEPSRVAASVFASSSARRGPSGSARGLVRLIGGVVLGAALSCGAPPAPVVSEPVAPPAPVRIEPVLTAEQRAALAVEYRGWQGRLVDEWAALLQLEQAGRLPPATAAMVRQAHARRAEAEQAQRADQLIAAAAAMHGAWAAASAANLAATVTRLVAAGDTPAAIAALGRFDLERARAVFGTPTPGAVDVLAVFQAGLYAWAQSALASESLRAASELIAGLQPRPAAERNAPATADAVAELSLRAVIAMRAADDALAGLARALAAPI